MPLLTVDEALAAILGETSQLGSEIVTINEAGGRVLAAPVIARLTQPPFNASAMDGYALRSSDIKEPPIKLKIVGESAAGAGFDGNVGEGEAVRIFTGAPVPHDTDTVVIQENTRRLDDSFIEIVELVAARANIRPKGGDFTKGNTVLEAGHRLTPSALALIAAAGHGEVTLFRKPRVAVLSTGDELVAAGTAPAPHQIVAANGYGLSEILRQNDCHVIDLGIAKDNASSIESAVKLAQQQNADLLLTSGGVSVGDYDLVQPVLQRCGMKLDFWKVAMRPGKPLMFGKLDGKNPMLVLGLPGNPISSLVCAQLFLVPMLAKMAGRRYQAKVVKAILASSLPANGNRRHYIRTTIHQNESGLLVANPQKSFDSSLLSLMAQADGLIIHEAMAGALREGDYCDVFIPIGGL